MSNVGQVCTLVFGMSLVGCASIISGSSQLMTVNANVDGAEVHIVSEAGMETLLGTTPLTTRVERGQEGFLRVRAEGYRPYQSALNRKINNVFWVNILLGGVIGSTTDYTTGAMYEYEPSTFMVSLQPTDLSRDGREQWERREALRQFVLLNAQALVAELAVADGEHVDLLVEVLGVTPQRYEEAIARWRAQYRGAKTTSDFAKQIVAELD